MNLKLGHNCPVDINSVPPEVRQAWEKCIYRDTYGGYKNGRSLSGFVGVLGGVSCTLDVARTTASNLVVDLGAGRGYAADGLAECTALSHDLRVAAIGLTYPYLYRPKVLYKVGGAETLGRCFARRSIACALAVCSLQYTARPDMLAESLKGCLADGGVVKAAFDLPEYGMQTTSCDTLLGHMRAVGFDAVATVGRLGNPILTAVNPGGRHDLPAAEIAEQDAANLHADSRLAEASMRGVARR